MKNITVKGQRLREGASDWYMRFHSNFDKDKRLWDILNQNYIIPRDYNYVIIGLNLIRIEIFIQTFK